MTLTRTRLEALVADVIRLGFEGADSIQQLAKMDALAGKHCDRYVPPLRFNPDSTKNTAYETTLMNARATIDDRLPPVEVPPPVKTESSPRAHVYERHADHEPDSAECRRVCDGGLAICMVCCGAEGTLATECPGVPMTRQESEAVYAGTLDYRGGAWVGFPTPKTTLGSNDA